MPCIRITSKVTLRLWTPPPSPIQQEASVEPLQIRVPTLKKHNSQKLRVPPLPFNISQPAFTPVIHRKNLSTSGHRTALKGITNVDASLVALPPSPRSPQSPPFMPRYSSIPSRRTDSESPLRHHNRRRLGPFTVVRKLAEGCDYADAFVARIDHGHATGGSEAKLVCLKIFDKKKLAVEKKQYLYLQELEAYKRIATIGGRLGSWFVMQADAGMEDRESLFLSMPLMHCDLMHFLDEQQSQKLSENRRRWIAQIAVGLYALHGVGIIHLDIKPENVLIDWRYNAVIADFGLSHIEPTGVVRCPDEYTCGYVGTWPYQAPEILANSLEVRQWYGPAVDYWALGCLVFDLETQTTLFANEKHYHEYIEYRPSKWNGQPYFAQFGLGLDVEPVLSGLLQLDPARRYTVHQLRSEPYFINSSGTSEFHRMRKRALERPLVQPISVDENQMDSKIYYPVVTPADGQPNTDLFSSYCWVNPMGMWSSGS